MTKGIVRNLDNLNRVVVPKEFYRVLGIQAGDPVDIYLEGDEVHIRKVEKHVCALCGTAVNLRLHFTNKMVCGTCVGGERR